MVFPLTARGINKIIERMKNIENGVNGNFSIKTPSLSGKKIIKNIGIKSSGALIAILFIVNRSYLHCVGHFDRHTQTLLPTVHFVLENGSFSIWNIIGT